MKKALPPIVAYILVCLIAVLIPASEGYNEIGWKLLVGQVYAIPTLIIVSAISYYVTKKKSFK